MQRYAYFPALPKFLYFLTIRYFFSGNSNENEKLFLFSFFLYIFARNIGKFDSMIIYSTTYTVAQTEAQNFVIYVHEVMLPAALASGAVTHPRLLHILSHKDENTECFSLQFETEDTAALHRWYTDVGAKLHAEMLKVFTDRVIGFPTMMEVVF